MQGRKHGPHGKEFSDMDNKIAREFHFGSLVRFSLPTIAMMLMMSLYSMVDGVFVARFVGTNAFSSINIIIPATFLVLGVGLCWVPAAAR